MCLLFFKGELMEEQIIEIDEKIAEQFIDELKEVVNSKKAVSQKENKMDIKTLAIDLVDNYCKTVAIDSFNACCSTLEVLKNRNVTLKGITEDTGDAFQAFIDFWNTYDDEKGIAPEDREPIKIYINSSGGNLFSTLTIIDAVNRSKTPVYTYNIGTAFSGGLLVLLCGHKRFSYKHASFLFHEGASGMEGDANKFQNYADFYKKLRIQVKDFVIERTKINEDEYAEHEKDDWWFFADEAYEKGFVDVIL